MATTTETTTTDAITKKHLVAYLKERVSGDADAPHRGLPFITEAGVLRVKPSDWIDWLAAQGIDAPKRDALAALKDAGLVQKVYALPAHDAHPELAGKSFGLYTGPAPAGTSRLPRRPLERKPPRAPRTRPASTKQRLAETSGAMAAEHAEHGPAN